MRTADSGSGRSDLSQPGVRAALLAMLVLDLVALLLSLRREHPYSLWVAGNFVSYFTIQTTALVIGLLFALLSSDVAAGSSGGNAGRRWDLLRGAVTSYAAITCIVYEFLLAPNPLDFTSNPPDTVMHVLIPIALVVLWVVRPPATGLGHRVLLWWLAYPIGYVAYTLLRGPVAHWYPYYFLDPTRSGGYPMVAAGVAILLVLASGIMSTILWLGRTRHAS